MNVLFHIGMPKSGSSALQSSLSASSDYLASKGVFYPVNPKFPSSQNHRLFATQVAPVCKLPRHMAGFGAQEEALAHFAALHAHIRGGIAARRPNLLLLSAETMFRQIHPDFRAGLVAAFAALGPAPSFVAYLRRPSEHYVSGLQQVLRRSSADRRAASPAPIQKGSDRLCGFVRRRPDFDASLQPGRAAPRRYRSGFHPSSLSSYGVEYEKLTRAGEVNISISAELMQIMQSFRREFHAGRDKMLTKDLDGLRIALRAADSAVDAPRSKLRPEIAEIVDYGAKDPLRLRARHGIVFPDFDYRRLRQGRLAAPPEQPLDLEGIVMIDREVQKAVIAHLRGSEWARGWYRGRWLLRMSRQL